MGDLQQLYDWACGLEDLILFERFEAYKEQYRRTGKITFERFPSLNLPKEPEGPKNG